MDDDKIKKLEERLMNRHPERTYNFFRPVGQIIEHVDTINFTMDKDGTFHFENIGQVNAATQPVAENKDTEEDQPEGDGGDDDALATVKKCFKFTSEFTKGKVEAVMNDHYHGSHAELALVEVALYDHGQLKRRNAHTAFIRALVAWGLIKIANEDELEQIRKGMTDKFRRIPKDGYKVWGDELLDDRITCDNISKQLGDTMPYIR